MEADDAKALGLEFKDVMALEGSGLNLDAFRKLIEGVSNLQIKKTEKALKEDYDKRLKELTNNHTKMLSKI